MAKGGAKLQVASNSKRLNVLRWLTYVPPGLYVVFGLFAAREVPRNLVLFLAFIIANVSHHIYRYLFRIAQPVYDEQGNLLDAGANLSQGGRSIIALGHDVLYISALTFIVACFTTKGFYLYLFAPAIGLFILYQMFGNVFRLFGGNNAGESQQDPKKKERAEKRAQKRASKWAR